MGYNTDLKGEMKFSREITEDEQKYIAAMFQEDEFDDYITREKKPHYIQFGFNHDFTGLVWDGSEKFYEIKEAMEFILDNVAGKLPDMKITGGFVCQGEDISDRYTLIIDGENVRKMDAMDALKLQAELTAEREKVKKLREALEEIAYSPKTITETACRHVAEKALAETGEGDD